LTLGSSPALAGTVVAEVNRNGGSPLADRIVVTDNPITDGGTMVLTNTGAPLQANDIFTLFSASNHSGSFTLVPTGEVKNRFFDPLAPGWPRASLKTSKD